MLTADCPILIHNLQRCHQVWATFLTLLPMCLADLPQASICACTTVGQMCVHVLPRTRFHENGHCLFPLGPGAAQRTKGSGAQECALSSSEEGGDGHPGWVSERPQHLSSRLLPPPTGLQMYFWKCPEAMTNHM